MIEAALRECGGGSTGRGSRCQTRYSRIHPRIEDQGPEDRQESLQGTASQDLVSSVDRLYEIVSFG